MNKQIIKAPAFRVGGTILFASLVCLSGAADEAGNETPYLPPEELAAVAAADRAYADAWLTGEPDKVMGTLTRDAVIVPSGMDAIAHPGPIRAFWFAPDSPPTIVHRFELVQEEVAGSSDLAFVRGTFGLSFDYDGTLYESEGTYLSLLRRGYDGTWRIARRTWNDHQRRVTD